MRNSALACVLFLASAACSSGSTGTCTADVDCGQQVCVGGTCVDCKGNGDCDTGEFCCQGICRPGAEVQERCGCAPSPSGGAGEDCAAADENALCLVDDAVATIADVAQGTCGCGCTPATGGPLCGAPAAEGGAPVCTCETNPQCAGASLDAQGRPHSVANTCLPNATCACVTAAGAASPCDIAGASPDCSFTDGCQALLDDPLNCGFGGRSCRDDATGIAGTGECFSGGCSCDAAADCRGADGGTINVDTCAFPQEGAARCACAGYRRGDDQLACPLELECAAGGCMYQGAAYATEEALLAALRLGPAP